MESSQFSDTQSRFDVVEKIESQGATCDTFRVKLYGKLHFLKRIKTEFTNDIRYQEALRKEFETGYLLEHPHLVRYDSLDGDSILMEYVDGENLAQRLSRNPDYFNDHKHTDKFVRQLLSVINYLHCHQVLHLDLKPDNIMLTRINDDVKLIDLGCCYTDTFSDTQGLTTGFAAPEQLANGQVDVRTDIYAFGKILELLPNRHIYNKVIARCTAEKPEDRYQTVDEILHDINHKRRYLLWLSLFVVLAIILSVAIVLFTHQPEQPATLLPKVQKDSVVTIQKDSVIKPAEEPKHEVDKKPKPSMNDEMEQMIDKAYRATIATFCDSLFPSPNPTTGKAWTEASTDFHQKMLEIASRLQDRYPDIPESTIYQETESRFQNLTSSVFNQMRKNGQNRK